MVNGKLFLNDAGRMLQYTNEEIGERCWIRKHFSIDLENPKASTLSIYAFEIKGNEVPLKVEVNGVPYWLNPDGAVQGWFAWRTLTLPEGVVKRELNTVQISSKNTVFNNWIVAVDNGNDQGTSFKSFDEGRTWSSERLGYDYSVRGEYLIRWYVEEGADRNIDQEEIHFVYQPLDHPELIKYRRLEQLDDVVGDARTDYEKAVRLCSWAARQWVHCGGRIYPPLHLPTLLHWRRNNTGHGCDEGVLGFCVLFAQALIQACWAMGIHARGLALPSWSGKEPDGHFIAEVYCRELNKWVVFDPDFDVHFLYEGTPLNVGELNNYWSQGKMDRVRIYEGPSFGHSHPKDDVDGLYFKPHMENGYAAFAIHRYQDYVSRPDHQMVAHGRHYSLQYHEPELVWFDQSLELKKQFPLVTDDLSLLYGSPTAGANMS